MVDNVDTVISIYNAVAKSIPLIRRIITVTGDAIANPQNYNVRIGTSYTELLEASGGFQAEPAKVISGGPMMGQALFDYNVPVTKTSSALTCLTKDEVAEHAPSACIRCGRCVKVCECGCCAYICPARRPLTQAFKEMRKEVAASRKKA